MRKAQMEVMGLAIIVILVFLAILFVTRFIVMAPPVEIRKLYTYEKLTTNTLDAMLKTTTECHELTVVQLLKDCGEYYAAGGSVDCLGMGSCAYVESVIDEILSETITPLYKRYKFRAVVESIGAEIVSSTSECPGERQASDPYPVRTDAGIMNVVLYVCD